MDILLAWEDMRNVEQRRRVIQVSYSTKKMWSLTINEKTNFAEICGIPQDSTLNPELFNLELLALSGSGCYETKTEPKVITHKAYYKSLRYLRKTPKLHKLEKSL
jgi:hypothetical protein